MWRSPVALWRYRATMVYCYLKELVNEAENVLSPLPSFDYLNEHSLDAKFTLQCHL
jgi:hypothetical protein